MDNLSEAINTTDVVNQTRNVVCFGEIVIAHVKDNMPVKFILLLIITPIICGLGIVGNILALVTFFHNRHKYRGNATFLMGLALCDNGVLLLTLALYSVEVLYAYLDSVKLYYAWASYLKVAYYLSHVFQISAVALTTLATIEQYLAVRLAKAQTKTITCTQSSMRMRIRRQLRLPGCAQKLILFTSMILICTFCIPKLLQVFVAHVPECPGYGRYLINVSPFGDTWFFKTLYEVWLTQILTVFIPFCLILIFNILIACQFTSSRKRESGVLIVVVATVFLFCNAPSVILTAMEHRFREFLDSHMFVYALLRDICNIFVTLNSAVNFYAYLMVGLEFRREFKQTLQGRVPWLGATFRLVSLPMKISQDVTAMYGAAGPTPGSPLSPTFESDEEVFRKRKAHGIRRSSSMRQTIGWFGESRDDTGNGNLDVVPNRWNSTIVEFDENSAEPFKCHTVQCNGNLHKSHHSLTSFPDDSFETLL